MNKLAIFGLVVLAILGSALAAEEVGEGQSSWWQVPAKRLTRNADGTMAANLVYCNDGSTCDDYHPVCCGAYCCASNLVCINGRCSLATGAVVAIAITIVVIVALCISIPLCCFFCACCAVCCQACRGSRTTTTTTYIEQAPLIHPAHHHHHHQTEVYTVATPAYQPAPVAYNAQVGYQAAPGTQAQVGYQAY